MNSNIDNEDIKKQIIAAMKASDSWLIVSHESPDGDTLGCAMTLFSLGRRMGKQVSVNGKSEMPQRYLFLAHASFYEVKAALSDEDAHSLIICVDTSTSERSVPGIKELTEAGALTINIDHHGDNTRYCALNLINPVASATAEIVEDLIYTAGWTMTKEESAALYVALSTDNGNFRFASTTPQSHICASRLLEAGAEPALLDDLINENLTAPILKLWGSAFSRTEILCGGDAALFWLLKNDYSSACADYSATDGLVNMLMRIRGVKIAVFISENSDTNKISVRTKEPYNAREFVSVFGGGGHVQASGAKIAGDFSAALTLLKEELVKYAAHRRTTNKQTH